MSESLRNDGRIWVPKNIEDVKKIRSGNLKPTEISEENRDYYLERRYQHLEILFLEMLLQGQQKKGLIMVWSKQNWRSCLSRFCFCNRKIRQAASSC